MVNGDKLIFRDAWYLMLHDCPQVCYHAYRHRFGAAMGNSNARRLRSGWGHVNLHRNPGQLFNFLTLATN
jgi:hypothetical protein